MLLAAQPQPCYCHCINQYCSWSVPKSSEWNPIFLFLPLTLYASWLTNGRLADGHQLQWKRINCKQSTRWQHLSRLKANAFFSLQKHLVSCMKCNNLYSGLVMPSSGWWSPIEPSLRKDKVNSTQKLSVLLNQITLKLKPITLLTWVKTAIFLW